MGPGEWQSPRPGSGLTSTGAAAYMQYIHVYGSSDELTRLDSVLPEKGLQPPSRASPPLRR